MMRFGGNMILANLFLLLLCSFGEARAQEEEVTEVWEYSPYRVLVWLALDRSPFLNDGVKDQIAEHLRDQSNAVTGAAWADIELVAAPKERCTDLVRDPKSLTVEQLLEHYADVFKFDKLIVVSVADKRVDFQVRACELDCQTREWGAVFSSVERQAGRLPAACFEQMMGSFSPVAQIEKTRGRSAYMRAKASGLILEPDNPAAVNVGDVLEPTIRQNTRLGEARRIYTPPWTYLVARERNRNTYTCQIISGVRSPLGRRSTRLTQMFAVKVNPPGDSTSVIVQTRDDPPQPLAGYEIHAQNIGDEMPERSANNSPDEEPPTLRIAITDWRGRAHIPVGGDSPLRLLYIQHGGVRLARMPLVPGLLEEVDAKIASDDLRLEAEGVVRGMQNELVDLVARRAILAIRIGQRLEDNKPGDAAKLLEELRTLQVRDDFEVRVEAQRRRFHTADSKEQKKIDRLFDETQDLVNKFLSPREFSELEQKVRSAGRSAS